MIFCKKKKCIAFSPIWSCASQVWLFLIGIQVLMPLLHLVFLCIIWIKNNVKIAYLILVRCIQDNLFFFSKYVVSNCNSPSCGLAFSESDLGIEAPTPPAISLYNLEKNNMKITYLSFVGVRCISEANHVLLNVLFLTPPAISLYNLKKI